MDWQVGEAVMIWSVRGQQMYSGIVEVIDKTLQIRVHSNGKLYNYNPDGTAIDKDGVTNQRVFSIRLLNEVKSDELQSASSW